MSRVQTVGSTSLSSRDNANLKNTLTLFLAATRNTEHPSFLFIWRTETPQVGLTWSSINSFSSAQAMGFPAPRFIADRRCVYILLLIFLLYLENIILQCRCSYLLNELFQLWTQHHLSYKLDPGFNSSLFMPHIHQSSRSPIPPLQMLLSVLPLFLLLTFHPSQHRPQINRLWLPISNS